MDTIINNIINDFDFTLMLIINFITYCIIKVIDENNGKSRPTTWQKRIVFIIVSVIIGLIYHYCFNITANIVFNSCIIAPVAWSWFAKPIANKLGIDYKKDI